mmetsp:Transcript_32581/g.106369  ORF Transcript_32581/g.106369 Transcript_32581/m.106369 type:complete len:435 (-) Transcript_32581:758-2062(-)
MPHYDSPASPADTPVQTGDYVSIHWDDLTVEGTSVKCPPHTVPAKVTSVSTEGFTAEMLFFQPPSSLVPRDFDYLFDDPDWERLEIGEMSERQRLKYLFDELKRFAVLVNQQLAPTNLDRIVSGKLETRGGLVELQLCCARQGRNGICARPVRFTAGGVERTAATLGKVQEYLDELAAAEPSGEGSRKVKRSGSGSGKSPSSKRAKGVSPPPEDDDEEDEEEGDEDEEEGDGEAEEEGEGFDSLFERAVALRVMTEADLDELTDAIASGVTSEEAVLAEWRRPLIRAAARRARRASAAPAASTATYRVVYRPLELAAPEGPGYVEGMATLSLGRGEAAHRSMQRYTKQKFRPSHGSSVGSLGPTRPELAALMHQYADAGVLSTHLRRQLRAPNPTSERDRRALHTEARLFVKQGITNNTTANGMKHYKNQSLMY